MNQSFKITNVKLAVFVYILFTFVPNMSFATYSIQMYSTQNEDKAKSVSIELSGKGYPSFYIKNEHKGKDVYRVFIGKFDAVNNAKNYKKQKLQNIGKRFSGFFIKKIKLELEDDKNEKQPTLIENNKAEVPFLNIGHNGYVTNISILEDSIISSDSNNQTKIWNKHNGRLIESIDSFKIYFDKYSVYSDADSGEIKIHERNNNKLNKIIKLSPFGWEKRPFDIHGHTVVYLKNSNTIVEWDLEKDKEISALIINDEINDNVFDLFIDKDVIITKGHYLLVWDRKTKKISIIDAFVK